MTVKMKIQQTAEKLGLSVVELWLLAFIKYARKIVDINREL
jgi:hypothetical protein